jgi:hypothetical protein
MTGSSPWDFGVIAKCLVWGDITDSSPKEGARVMMSHSRKERWLGGLALVLALFILPACGDDSPTGPAGPPPLVDQLDTARAEDWSLQALASINEMAADMSTWAANAPGTASKAAQGPGDPVPVWDEGEQAWTYSYDGPLFEVEPPNVWDLRVELWLQYRSGTTALPVPLGATEMEVHMSTGMTVHNQTEQGSSDMEYDFETQVIVTNLDADSYAVVGQGASLVQLSEVSAAHEASLTFAMDWSLDMEVSPSGCPSGIATIHSGDFEMVATYDGAGGVAWIMSGEGYTASGTEMLECTPSL